VQHLVGKDQVAGANFRVGAPRMRQSRIVRRSCEGCPDDGHAGTAKAAKRMMAGKGKDHCHQDKYLIHQWTFADINPCFLFSLEMMFHVKVQLHPTKSYRWSLETKRFELRW
jgi:hypothetical protein